MEEEKVEIKKKNDKIVLIAVVIIAIIAVVWYVAHTVKTKEKIEEAIVESIIEVLEDSEISDDVIDELLKNMEIDIDKVYKSEDDEMDVDITISNVNVLDIVEVSYETGGIYNSIIDKAAEVEVKNAEGMLREGIAIAAAELIMAAYTDVNRDLDISAKTIISALSDSNYMPGYSFTFSGDVITATGNVNMIATLDIVDGVYKGVDIEPILNIVTDEEIIEKVRKADIEENSGTIGVEKNGDGYEIVTKKWLYKIAMIID